METFIIGLLLAGVSATSVVAFKHPRGYARLFPYLVGLVTVLFVAITLWQIAVQLTWEGVEDFVDPNLNQEAEKEKERLSLPYHWVVLWYLGVVVFFWVNLRLPAFLLLAEENQVGAKKKNSH